MRIWQQKMPRQLQAGAAASWEKHYRILRHEGQAANEKISHEAAADGLDGNEK